MAQRVTGTNNNYKIFNRIRPIEYPQKMIEITSDTSLTIRDPSQKASEKQPFSFNGIFDSQTNQETVWSHTTEPVLQKLIEGHNGVVLNYGQTGAGKSFTIFGEDERYSLGNMNLYVDGRKDRRGLVPRTVEFLFRKAQELEDIREFVITCSFAEIYLDQVRDLGRAYLQNPDERSKKNAQQVGNVMNNYEHENLTIKESTNGQVIIQDLSQITVGSMNDLYDLLSAGYLLRDKFETKGSQIWNRAHTIFTVNLVQKDKENDMIPFLNSTIQFVDLAGSERIAKSLTEGHKFQEAILINSSLTSLSKCLQMIAKSSKSVPYRETKLTKILQNCMTYSSHTILFVNLNPSESNYEECLSSLQFGERTRNTTMGQKTSTLERQSVAEDFVMNVGGTFAGSEKVVKKLQDEISDLKSKLEFNQREHREKLSKIQELLGLEIDLDKVLNKSSQKELFQFKVQKEAMIKLENVQKINQDLEHKVERLDSLIKEFQFDERIKVEENTRVKVEQSEIIKQLKDKLSQNKLQNETQVQQLKNERENEIKNMIEQSNQLLEEKANMILNLPVEIERKTQENAKLLEVKKATQYEIEKQSKQQIDNLKQEYDKLLKNSKEQYEFFLKQKNEEIENYIAQLKKYREKKNTQVKELNEELKDLYNIIQQQGTIISKVETGQYSGGIRSFNIPSRDKPHLPSRQKHKNLFQILDQTHLQYTLHSEKMRHSQKNLKSNMSQKNMETINSEKQYNNTNINNNESQQLQQNESKRGITMKNQREKEIYDKLDDMVDLQVNLQKISQQKDFDQFSNLKVYTERIRDSLQQSLIREKELKKRVTEFDQINNMVDIQQVVKEKDEYKQKYWAEVRKHNMTRVTIESQKRLISAKNQSAYNSNPQNNLPLPQVQAHPHIQVFSQRPNTVGERRFRSTAGGGAFSRGADTGTGLGYTTKQI